MAVRGGSNDVTLPLIASETIGTDQGQVIRLDKGASTTRVPVTDTDGLPVEGVAGGTPMPVSHSGLSGGILQSVTTVGTTAVAVPATPLAGRATMLVQADSANTANIYLGVSTVTADTAATGGIMLLPGQSIPISLAAAVILYARSTAASQSVRTFEVAA